MKIKNKIMQANEIFDLTYSEYLKILAVRLDRAGFKEQADKLFNFALYIKRELAKAATFYNGVKEIITTAEALTDGTENKDTISEMRFEKSFPNIKLAGETNG